MQESRRHEAGCILAPRKGRAKAADQPQARLSGAANRQSNELSSSIRRREGSMDSVAARLARQAVGAVAASVLLIGAIYGGVSGAPQKSAARQRVEPPIKVQSVVFAQAPIR